MRAVCRQCGLCSYQVGDAGDGPLGASAIAITVNSVQPGPTDTDMNPAAGPMAMHSFMAIKRHIGADEIAEFTAFLAGPHGAMITGSMQTIDGGFAA